MVTNKQKPKIAISQEAKAKLDKLVINKTDTYEDIILRLIKDDNEKQKK